MTRLTDRETVGVAPLPHSWCWVHDAVWLEGDDECDYRHIGFDDGECQGVPLYVGMPDPDGAA